MKKIILSLVSFLVLTGLVSPEAFASDPDLVLVSGVVKDSRTRRTLENVVVSVPGSNINVVTNADGVFALKIPSSADAGAVHFSHIGYISLHYPITRNGIEDATILLTSTAYPIKEIVIRLSDPMKIIEEALSRVSINYSDEDNMFTIFYRETARKRNNYINISEAVAFMNKTSYDKSVSHDLVEIYKGRRLVSPKPNDTLAIKLLGGINLASQLDIIKNQDVIFTDILEGYYNLSLGASDMIDDRPHYVVMFSPAKVLPYPLLYGKFFIDQESYVVSRAEFSVSMEDKSKAEKLMVRRKPLGLRFEPEEISYLITYKESNGRCNINYIRSEYRFRCDWKRRLFSNRYAIVSETVVTDIEKAGSNHIRRRDAIFVNQSISDKLEYFYDEHYWEDFNIIEPTESLETGIKRLKKKQ